MPEEIFSGSYAPEDCQFLLKRIRLEPVSVEEKERLIQSGTRHYSQMISAEKAPSARYMELFEEAMERNGQRLARDLVVLAREMDRTLEGEIVLASLARAGTPMGVVLGRILRERFHRRCTHYSISIVRDRGVDHNAILHILSQGHSPESIAFVDGWTGKGTIARELARSLGDFRTLHGVDLDPGIWTVADLSGSAKVAATGEDYLIPSSLLNATVSGLVSRTILHEDHLGPEDFHGCLHLEQFLSIDRSRWFVDRIQVFASGVPLEGLPEPLRGESADSVARRDSMEGLLRKLSDRFKTAANRHFVKPGIGEATRVLLRRVPEVLLLAEAHHPETLHLRHLAAEKSVPVEVDPSLPVKAVALIRGLD